MRGVDNPAAMGKRLNIYLPDGIAERLENWAKREGRSMSSLATFLIELGIRDEEARELQRSRNKSETESKP